MVGSTIDTANVAFRFPVIQGSKIRACGDFKNGLINLCASDWNPITLPTWGHIGQIAAGLSFPPRDWSFTKADHKADYKNLPLNLDQSQFCIVALRSPGDAKWYGFAPRTLLFASSAAAHRYNCFSRVLAVIINRLFGLHIVNYFGDLGSTVPTSLSDDGLRLLIDVCALFGVILEDRKTDLCLKIVFLCLLGRFLGPETDMPPPPPTPPQLVGREEGSTDGFHPQCVESRSRCPQGAGNFDRPLVLFPNVYFRKLWMVYDSTIIPQIICGLLPTTIIGPRPHRSFAAGGYFAETATSSCRPAPALPGCDHLYGRRNGRHDNGEYRDFAAGFSDIAKDFFLRRYPRFGRLGRPFFGNVLNLRHRTNGLGAHCNGPPDSQR